MKRKVWIAAGTLVAGYLLLCIALWMFQEVLLFPGAHRPSATPARLGGVEQSTLRTVDGLTYRIAIGRPIGSAESVQGVLLFFMGNGEDLSAGVFHAANFAGHGFLTLVTEYPGYGDSEGRPGYREVLAAAERSAAEAKKWAAERSLPLFVAGHSLGTFPALHLAAQGIGQRLFLKSPPTNIAQAGQDRFPFLPVKMLLRHPFDNLANAKKIRVPTLIVHGDRDSVVPVVMGRQVAAAIPGARLEVLTGQGHNNISMAPDSEVGRMLRDHLLR